MISSGCFFRNGDLCIVGGFWGIGFRLRGKRMLMVLRILGFMKGVLGI